MKVIMLAHTPNPGKLAAAAARLCYSKLTPSEVYDGLTDEKVRKLLTDIRASGHMSPFEHAVFTFGVSGLSRVASHQLVRHRVASFSQQSQRYVSMKENTAVVPPSIASDPERLRLYEEAADKATEYYNNFLDPERSVDILENLITTKRRSYKCYRYKYTDFLFLDILYEIDLHSKMFRYTQHGETIRIMHKEIDDEPDV